MSESEVPTKTSHQDNVSAQEAKLSAGQVMLGNEILIDLNKNLHQYQHGYAQAIEAHNVHYGQKYVAYISRAKYLPRLNSIARYVYSENNNLLKLFAHGTVLDRGAGQEYYAFVFETPDSKPFLKDWKSLPPDITHEMLLSKVLRPLLKSLLELNKNGLVHGAINLRNIFYHKIDDEIKEVMLGECLSSAVSFDNPVLYETIERGMTQPAGRGVNSIKEDLYSLGICIAMLAWKQNPMATMSDADILEGKIEKGSYGLISTGKKTPSALTEFLRGVLNDDVAQRWDLSDVEKWLEGQRLSPKQPASQLKAARSFEYKGQKYFYLKTALRAIGQSTTEEAYSTFTSPTFLNWFMRNFDDKNLLANLEIVLERFKVINKNGAYKERYIAEMLCAIDPSGPVRYKKLAIQARGFGNALADAFARNEDIQEYAEVLNNQLLTFWLSMQINMPADSAQLANDFERARQFINQKMVGAGIERVAYMGCVDAPCFSPQFAKDFIGTPAHLLSGLNRKMDDGSLKEPSLDRHIVAFLSVREPKVIDPHMGLVTSTKKGPQLFGMLQTLAIIQVTEKVGPMVAVTDYLIKKSKLMIDDIKSLKLREKLQKQADNLKGKGDLAALLKILNNKKLVQQDLNEFFKAQQEYQRLEIRKLSIAGTSARKKEIGARKGRQVAMVISAVLASLAMVFHIANFFTG